MGYPTAGTEYRSARSSRVTELPAANQDGAATRRPPVSRGPAGAPAARRPVAPSPPARGRRGVPLRLTIALLVTVGAVVLLGMADGAASDDLAGADCATSPVTVADLSAVQTRNARAITEVARERDLDRSAAEIAVATSLAETGLINFANDGTSELYAAEIDRPLSDLERDVARRSLAYPHDEVGNNLDSIGLFQQRPTTGWGAPEKLIDPRSASGLFYDHLLKIPDWAAGVPWQTAQKVQSSPSADGGIYEKSYERAVLVVGALWAEPMCPSA